MGVKRMARTPEFRKWRTFHYENPHVWEEFQDHAYELINSGVTKSSAWLIINKMRWDHAIKTNADDFKISNDFIAYYTRLFRAMNPKHVNFFTIKPMKGENNE